MASDDLILGFDTSAAHCAAALLSGDRVLSARSEDMGRGQAERLMPLLEELLADHGKCWQDLTAIGVGTGPGNFTGIRISVSAARGLALALGIPAVGVSGFRAAAFERQEPFAVKIPGPREQVYVQVFDGSESQPALMSQGDLGSLNLPVFSCPTPDMLAVAITRCAALQWQKNPESPAPLYIKPADAAPSSDPPPVILDDA